MFSKDGLPFGQKSIDDLDRSVLDGEQVLVSYIPVGYSGEFYGSRFDMSPRQQALLPRVAWCGVAPYYLYSKMFDYVGASDPYVKFPSILQEFAAFLHTIFVTRTEGAPLVTNSYVRVLVTPVSNETLIGTPIKPTASSVHAIFSADSLTVALGPSGAGLISQEHFRDLLPYGFVTSKLLVSSHNTKHLHLRIVGPTSEPSSLVKDQLGLRQSTNAFMPTYALVAGKGSGKSAWNKRLADRGYISIDSDVYGQLLSMSYALPVISGYLRHLINKSMLDDNEPYTGDTAELQTAISTLWSMAINNALLESHNRGITDLKYDSFFETAAAVAKEAASYEDDGYLDMAAGSVKSWSKVPLGKGTLSFRHDYVGTFNLMIRKLGRLHLACINDVFLGLEFFVETCRASVRTQVHGYSRPLVFFFHSTVETQAVKTATLGDLRVPLAPFYDPTSTMLTRKREIAVRANDPDPVDTQLILAYMYARGSDNAYSVDPPGVVFERLFPEREGIIPELAPDWESETAAE